MGEAKHFQITVQEGSPVVEALSAASGLTKQAVKAAMQKGAVWWRSHNKAKNAQRLRRAKRELAEGCVVDFYYNPAVLNEQALKAGLLDDQGDYSVWVKPNGMLSQGSKWGDHCTLQRFAELHLQPQRNAFVVHRLDKATSGLMLLAHSKKAAHLFSQLFVERKIHKTYVARVQGRFPSERQTYTQALAGKEAISHAQLLAVADGASLIEVDIETGRKHQIRQHLAQAGYPVVADRLYGDADTQPKQDIALAATQLCFVCPISGQEKTYVLGLEQQKVYCPSLFGSGA